MWQNKPQEQANTSKAKKKLKNRQKSHERLKVNTAYILLVFTQHPHFSIFLPFSYFQ